MIIHCPIFASPSNARTSRLEEDEEEHLLIACKQSRNLLLNYLVVLVAIETGMRLGELLKIEWQHVNLVKRTIFLGDTKNGSNRTFPLSHRAIEALSIISTHI
ncbi:tyrosine-type recombinase/integrase [Nitrosomonas communis]|uniref:tyrosine-type recombinase/integrase n=1 Tax=Nitrosomonas communis TaxID=44574 RepID=UPI0009429C7C